MLGARSWWATTRATSFLGNEPTREVTGAGQDLQRASGPDPTRNRRGRALPLHARRPTSTRHGEIRMARAGGQTAVNAAREKP
eukprot:9194589-Lingulodinium_polyedra.AAC.1